MMIEGTYVARTEPLACRPARTRPSPPSCARGPLRSRTMKPLKDQPSELCKEDTRITTSFRERSTAWQARPRPARACARARAM